MSIHGTGIDMIEIARIERAIKREGFAHRVFGPSELELFSEQNWHAQTAAANFCAKEAFSKALGTGLRGIKLREIEVLRKSNGQPYFKLSGSARRVVQDLNLKLHLSITHERAYACAVVIAESEDVQ